MLEPYDPSKPAATPLPVAAGSGTTPPPAADADAAAPASCAAHLTALPLPLPQLLAALDAPADAPRRPGTAAATAAHRRDAALTALFDPVARAKANAQLASEVAAALAHGGGGLPKPSAVLTWAHHAAPAAAATEQGAVALPLAAALHGCQRVLRALLLRRGPEAALPPEQRAELAAQRSHGGLAFQLVLPPAAPPAADGAVDAAVAELMLGRCARALKWAAAESPPASSSGGTTTASASGSGSKAARAVAAAAATTLLACAERVPSGPAASPWPDATRAAFGSACLALARAACAGVAAPAALSQLLRRDARAVAPLFSDGSQQQLGDGELQRLMQHVLAAPSAAEDGPPLLRALLQHGPAPAQLPVRLLAALAAAAATAAAPGEPARGAAASELAAAAAARRAAAERLLAAWIAGVAGREEEGAEGARALLETLAQLPQLVSALGAPEPAAAVAGGRQQQQALLAAFRFCLPVTELFTAAAQQAARALASAAAGAGAGGAVAAAAGAQPAGGDAAPASASGATQQVSLARVCDLAW